MIGLGVGIDYALFVVTRFRENYLRDGDVGRSIAVAMDTAGRAVLFAGATAIIALLGQFALGVAFLYGLAVASSLAVLMTMLAALTVLPALLARFGERIGRARASHRRARSGATSATVTGDPGAPASGFWSRWSGLIERYPWQGAIAGLAIMVTLASPALALRLVIPLQAAVMNLLSIGGSLGVVVAIFQWGWLGSIFGVKGAPIQAFIPVLLFAIVFGLSMDYEVFLVSRIHEEWTRSGDPRQAVRHGFASTGRVVTAAATIMICVFISFAVGDERVLKLFGLSLASAVFGGSARA
jgi:uncharacterized membrane protein YdfJ with MMPL/SSD domain